MEDPLSRSGGVETVSLAEWKGSSFIADEWDLPYKKLSDRLGFKTRYPAEEAKKLLMITHDTYLSARTLASIKKEELLPIPTVRQSRCLSP